MGGGGGGGGGVLVRSMKKFLGIYHIAKKVLLDNNFTKPSYLCIAEMFGGINFSS